MGKYIILKIDKITGGKKILNIETIIKNELEKYKLDINKIYALKNIDCVTIFSNSEADYNNLNNELSNNIKIEFKNI